METDRHYSINVNESDDMLTVHGEIKTRLIEHDTDLLSITTKGNEEEENQFRGAIAGDRNYDITILGAEAVNIDLETVGKGNWMEAKGIDCTVYQMRYTKQDVWGL